MVIRGEGLTVVDIPYMVITRVYRADVKVFVTVSTLLFCKCTSLSIYFI